MRGGNARAALGQRDRVVLAIVENQGLDRLAARRDCLRDVFDIGRRPADHQSGADVGMTAECRQRATLQRGIFAEQAAAERCRDHAGTGDRASDAPRRRSRESRHGHHQHVVAYADRAIGPPEALEMS